jgi:peptidoglycan biosynthesis protein MviN/MurJ (putative lipid II flippase)
MSFREKIHWVSFLALVGAFGWYFASYPWDSVKTAAGIGAVAGKLVPVTIVIIAVMSVGAAWFAIRSPKEAYLKEDEREHIIHIRGTHIAYYPLVLGVWGNMIAMFWHLSIAQHLNLLIATVVIAELVRVGSQLYLYRKAY